MSAAKPMTISRRTRVYLAQNNGGPLTPPQRRRYDKKNRKWMGQHTAELEAVARGIADNHTKRPDLPVGLVPFEEIAEEVIAPVEDFPVVVRPCGGTDHCVTKSGKKAKTTHKGCEGF
ncbi:hypothetical protein E1264_03395 [Actinomadura sp. KC216]|uniref:hypothetical protein n=1 Tax=Actinomadura sp. KC216 TaxID=2530370 RepID=UPI0010495958|nr:hypothetical protein [Actinomadura sp. KC216]TDB90884.1 hypothetical protein E1264_03395 [Actinomadura sp. KC216]